jgi:hypothetical protein
LGGGRFRGALFERKGHLKNFIPSEFYSKLFQVNTENNSISDKIELVKKSNNFREQKFSGRVTNGYFKILTSNSISNSYFSKLCTYQHFPNHLQTE